MLAAIVIHFGLTQWVLEIQKSYFVSIYIFVLLLLVISSLMIVFLEKSFKEQLGYFFLVVVAFKLLAAKLFIDSFLENKEVEFKLSLIILYLISLGLITWFTAQKLLKQENWRKAEKMVLLIKKLVLILHHEKNRIR